MNFKKIILLIFLFFSMFGLAENTLAQQAADTVSWPLKVSADKRYLEDQKGAPFFIMGDSPWTLLVQVSDDDIAEYLTLRKAQGFSAVIVDAIEKDGGPHSYYGDAPFLRNYNGVYDLATPNSAYFVHVDALIQSAYNLNMAVFLFPAYLGNNPQSGWEDVLATNTTSKIQTYGTWIANRYKNYQNIIWMGGGDSHAQGDFGLGTKHDAFMNAIKAVDTDALISAHGNRWNTALNSEYNKSWVSLNQTYTGGGTTSSSYMGCDLVPSGVYAGYEDITTMPFVMFEAYYEGQGNITTNGDHQCTRANSYWSHLGGAAGSFYGHTNLWKFPSNWRDYINTIGSAGMSHLVKLFKTINWWKLVPDYSHTVVTAGYGNIIDDTYVAAARASDGSSVIVYAPYSNTTFTVNMTKITGSSIKAYWYNPQIGATTYIAEYLPTGSRSFTTGSKDWILILNNTGGTPNIAPASPTGVTVR